MREDMLRTGAEAATERDAVIATAEGVALAISGVVMMAAAALLEENPDPTEDEIRWALSGNLCRCTGYQNIVKSVLWAAAKLRADGNGDTDSAAGADSGSET